jgi:hypothetical protein
MARPAWHPHQAVPVQDGVDRALGGHAHLASESPHQELADLAGTPVRLLLLAGDDQALDLRRQLVGVAHRPPRAIAQRLEAVLLVAAEDLVAGLARHAEGAAGLRYRLALQQAGHEPQALVHHRTLRPGHPHLPPAGGRCYPCVRYDLSPISRATQSATRSQSCQRYAARGWAAVVFDQNRTALETRLRRKALCLSTSPLEPNRHRPVRQVSGPTAPGLPGSHGARVSYPSRSERPC